MEEHFMHASLTILSIVVWSDSVAVAQNVEQTTFRLVSTHDSKLINQTQFNWVFISMPCLAHGSQTLNSRTFTFVFVNRSLMFSRLTVRHGNVFWVKTATTELVRRLFRWEDGKADAHTQTTNLTMAHYPFMRSFVHSANEILRHDVVEVLKHQGESHFVLWFHP